MAVIRRAYFDYITIKAQLVRRQVESDSTPMLTGIASTGVGC